VELAIAYVVLQASIVDTMDPCPATFVWLERSLMPTKQRVLTVRQVTKAIKVTLTARLATQASQEMGLPVKSAEKEHTVRQGLHFAHPAQRANFPNLAHLPALIA